MKRFAIAAVVMMVVLQAQSQPRFFFAAKQCRDSVSQQLKQQVDRTIALPLHDSTYQRWMGAYWAMELMLYQPAGYEQLIPVQIAMLPKTGPGFQRAFMEMLYTLYLNKYDAELKVILPHLKSDKVKAMVLEYLSASGTTLHHSTDPTFTRSSYYPLYQYQRSKKEQALPSRNDFLHSSFLPGETVLCSFQSTDRNKPGYLMIRLADGTWMKNEQDEELRFPQLARSISNLPFYLTNGNTPQGLYKVTGVDTSENNWIGPTTNLQMILPFENNASDFFGTDTAYEKYYSHLLGHHLQQFLGLKESYWAGKMGRTEIIAHGTTIDPEYYKHQLYYPNTPSLGCLCSPELWNEKGECTYSAQAAWIIYILSGEIKPQWLIVAEVIDL
ncbi:MAG: hypothetical protein HEQ40_15400 [Lacibacter sp.]